MSSANERQVGGDHYKTGGVELWDLPKPEGLVFYAVRYVQRWRKKNGVVDLEKAAHSVEKILESAEKFKNYRLQWAVADDKVLAWIHNSGMDWVEQRIAKSLMFVVTKDNLLDALDGIKFLNATATPKVANFGPAVVVGGNTPSCGGGLADDHARQRAIALPSYPLAPWVVDDAWLGRSEIAQDLIDCFWTQRTLRVYVLDPHVVCTNIPRTLRHYYDQRGDGNWTLIMRLCPVEARDYFPTLESTLNITEWSEAPEWQRVLYTWSDTKTKYELTERTAAWHIEEEVEQ